MDDLFAEDFYDELAKAYPDMREELAKYLDDAALASLNELFEYYGQASTVRVDPLVFDLGNDGVKMPEEIKKAA